MTPTCSIHCAESAEEWEMFTAGRGKLWEFVKERGAEAFDKNRSPIQHLAQHNLLPTRPWLAVHCNTLTDDDIVLLKKSRATVVHCPRSHRFFNHPPFPLEKLRAASVPIAIGTDSLASCPNFDFLAELRAMRDEFPFLSTEEILNMATGNRMHTFAGGVRRGSRSGSVRVSEREDWETAGQDPQHFGPITDIIGLPMQDDILQGPVTFSMIGGKRVI